MRVWVDDLTDEQLEAAAAARRRYVDHSSPRDRKWLRLIAAQEWAERRVARRAEDRRIKALHSCSRCGIDTTAPDVCIDCADVLALDVQWSA